jgi:hypothetical protein
MKAGHLAAIEAFRRAVRLEDLAVLGIGDAALKEP